jgi:hypothetical protein
MPHYGLASVETMTIRYSDGRTIEGIAFARTAKTMRVAMQDWDDIVEFTNVHGTWVSEDCEPVTIQRSPQRTPIAPPSEADCICSHELAAHLIKLLLTDSAEEEWDRRAAFQRPEGVLLSERVV